jgi:hypothetical protein
MLSAIFENTFQITHYFCTEPLILPETLARLLTLYGTW